MMAVLSGEPFVVAVEHLIHELHSDGLSHVWQLLRSRLHAPNCRLPLPNTPSSLEFLG